jgi:hypothetical protein
VVLLKLARQVQMLQLVRQQQGRQQWQQQPRLVVMVVCLTGAAWGRG